jgi:very-short-patch-repair endonuclease
MSTEEKKLFIPTPVPAPLLEAARSLRKNMTDAEQLLWRCLRRKQLGGFRFRRQHPIDRFVLDFYCCEAKLAIELDGGQHNEPGARLRDHERTTILHRYGIRVVRFWNSEVLDNPEGVLQKIYSTLQHPPPNLPPLGGGALLPPQEREGRGGGITPSPGAGGSGRGKLNAESAGKEFS